MNRRLARPTCRVSTVLCASTAQLVGAGTGVHLWTEQIEVAQDALPTSQDNFGIANRLARALSVESTSLT